MKNIEIDPAENIRPSERLKRLQAERREKMEKTRSVKEAETIEKAKPHIEVLQKYIGEPKEIAAYLELSEDVEGLSVAIYEVFWREILKAQFDGYADHKLRNDKNYHTAINLIGNNKPSAQSPNETLFEKTSKSDLLRSLSILSEFLRGQRQRLDDLLGESIGIEFQFIKNEKTGKLELVPINGTGDLDASATNNNLFSWKRVEKFLPTLPTDATRLSYLINIRARFNKMSAGARKDMNPSEDFSHNCGVEIERLEKLMPIEQIIKKQNEFAEESNYDRKRIIEAYLRASKKKPDKKIGELDLLDELKGHIDSKPTLRRRMKNCGLPRIRDIVSATEEMKEKSS